MMVALLLYAYAIGERSSRGIERRCVEDVATRVICANSGPITRRSALRSAMSALDGLFGERRVRRGGSVRGMAGPECRHDGTGEPVPARDASYEEIAREILAEAEAVDAAEDEQFGERRGDELPSELATARAARLAARGQRRLEVKRADEARPIPRRGRVGKEAKRRLEEEHEVECRANAD